ncbi:iron chelate uptake ABC transporter family permease subunit [Bacillus hwajinpoensis]|uniref:Manganese transport system membrane protein MntC n=1 Tax=Guptibacillus hwajinpoensis TaxID=208199 RepID=A0A845F1I8_9BACL|nr:metal ABC transporter permease [Pseudalkalibacillus hwajinpoensis]MYL64659.1 iron chelate uptake ABC transporter family permease subunit [Pseudalkalibacillus hwajinpoensis]
MFNDLILTLQDANTQWVLFGTILLGVASGVLGSFALLRKQSLIGDAMAHAALPGICLAFLLYGTKSIGWFLVGAAISGLLATYFIQVIINHSRIKEDTAIGLVLSVFFGFGIVLLTKIAQSENGNQSGLDDFIFGQAASLVGNDVRVISGVAIVLLIVTWLLFKELKLFTFDRQFAQGIGLPTGLLNGLLMALIVSAVVIGLQAVGVILMAAMLITPAISARYWTDRLDRMVIVAGTIGALSGMLGTLLSSMANRLPTGPVIVLAATVIFLISLIFAPNRGLVSKGLKLYRIRKIVARETVLQTMYDLSEEASITNNKLLFSKEELLSRRKMAVRKLDSNLKRLQKEGYVHRKEDLWYLTESGGYEAHEIVLNNRLFEIYTMYEMKFASLQFATNDVWDYKKISSSTLHELEQLMAIHERTPKLEPEYFGEGETLRKEKSSQSAEKRKKEVKSL